MKSLLLSIRFFVAIIFVVAIYAAWSHERSVWVILVASLIMALVFYLHIVRQRKSITQLRRFAKKADRNEPFDLDEEISAFPKGELGEISQHIVRLYLHLKQSKKDQIRLKRQLTQNISHELKTPISSIQGYLETIIETPDIDAEKRQQFLQRCHAQSLRLTSPQPHG